MLGDGGIRTQMGQGIPSLSDSEFWTNCHSEYSKIIGFSDGLGTWTEDEGGADGREPLWARLHQIDDRTFALDEALCFLLSHSTRDGWRVPRVPLRGLGGGHLAEVGVVLTYDQRLGTYRRHKWG